jgi:hypothetical protein
MAAFCVNPGAGISAIASAHGQFHRTVSNAQVTWDTPETIDQIGQQTLMVVAKQRAHRS